MTNRSVTDDSSKQQMTRPVQDLSIDHLYLIRQVAGLTASIRNRNLLLTRALELLISYFAATGGGIYQLHDRESPLNLVAQMGISDDLSCELQKVPAGKGLIAQVIESEQPTCWSPLEGEAELYCQALLDAGWDSLFAYPLIAHERLIGVFFLYQDSLRDFSPDEFNLLGECCQLLAAAID